MTAARFVRLPRVKWVQAVSKINPEELQRLQRELEAMAPTAAAAAAYIGQRDGFGCGDQGHAKAVQESNRVMTKVRKALGFHITYPIRF